MITDNLCHSGNYHEFEGESTDTKPTDGIGVNSKFTELDTGDKYYFDGSDWQEIGGTTS